ncbi:42018_t:CDS:1, partial [Gigaspora margarita]
MWKLHRLMCVRIRQHILEILRISKTVYFWVAISYGMQTSLSQCYDISDDGFKRDADCHAL